MLIYFIMFAAVGVISTLMLAQTKLSTRLQVILLFLGYFAAAVGWGSIHSEYWGIVSFIEMAIGSGAALLYIHNQ